MSDEQEEEGATGLLKERPPFTWRPLFYTMIYESCVKLKDWRRLSLLMEEVLAFQELEEVVWGKAPGH